MSYQPTLNHPSDLDEFFKIPAIYTADMSPEEWDQEIDRLFTRAQMSQAFVDGRISPNDFMDVLDATGIDPIQAADAWESGLILF